MKNLINIWALCILAGITLVSCKKNKIKINTEQPVQSASKTTSLLDSTRNFPGFAFYEMGSKVYFSKPGKVTKLGCRAGATGKFVVSFWDFDSHELLAQTKVTITDKDKFFYNAVSPVQITANKRYVVSMNNNNEGIITDYWLCYRKSTVLPNEIEFNVYPLSVGSVTFEDIRSVESSTAVFPSTIISAWNFSAGADVQFEYE
ncbi:MAG: hypothetical protein U0U67_05835 [Chitinophagales bacterium]